MRGNSQGAKIYTTGGKVQKTQREEKGLSNAMVIILGILITLEIMVTGGMLLADRIQSFDVIGIGMAFFVIFCGVVAVISG